MNRLEFAKQLAKQLRFLSTSCREYDSGNFDEAIRMATAMRVMSHNTGASTSLLLHLGATLTEMLSTCGRRPSDHPDGFWIGFIKMEFDVATIEVRSKPTFNSRPGAHRRIPFSAWWNGDVIFYGGGRRFDRKRLITDAANKDGGAHVDATLPDDYKWMADGAGVSFKMERPDGFKIENFLFAPHLACLRQIAHEVLSSPELLALGGLTGDNYIMPSEHSPPDCVTGSPR